MSKSNRKRAGRKRKEGVIREPNGRVSRTGIAHDPADQVALEARMRHLGLNKDEARNQKAATFIGYLNMLGPRDGLSDDQYEAALDYLKHRDRLLRALKAPGAMYDPEATGGSGDEDAYAKWVQRLKQTDADIRKAVQEAQNYSRENLWAALDYILIRDEHHHHMIGATRILCNVFARHFKTVGNERRAA